MPRRTESAMAAIGRYMVLSILVAGVLVTRDVPFWCAFPLVTIATILRTALEDDDRR